MSSHLMTYQRAQAGDRVALAKLLGAIFTPIEVRLTDTQEHLVIHLSSAQPLSIEPYLSQCQEALSQLGLAAPPQVILRAEREGQSEPLWERTLAWRPATVELRPTGLAALELALHQLLNRPDLTVKCREEKNQLQILLETEQPPPQTELANQVTSELPRLGVSTAKNVILYGRERGQMLPLWSQELTLTPAESPPLKGVVGDINLDDLAAFVGAASSFYGKRWRGFLFGGDTSRWNWAAFLAGDYWLVYRGMYRYTFIYLAMWTFLNSAIWLFFATTVFAQFQLAQSSEKLGQALLVLGFYSLIAVGLTALFGRVVLGRFGDWLYFDHVRRQVKIIKVKHYQPEKQRQLFQRWGGRHIPQLIGYIFMAPILSFLFRILIQIIPEGEYVLERSLWQFFSWVF